MKNKSRIFSITMIIAMVLSLIPARVKADPGGPAYYNLTYNAYVKAKEGIEVWEEDDYYDYYGEEDYDTSDSSESDDDDDDDDYDDTSVNDAAADDTEINNDDDDDDDDDDDEGQTVGDDDDDDDADDDDDDDYYDEGTEEDCDYYDDEDYEADLVIPYKTVVKVVAHDEDGNICFEYERKVYCTSPKNLVGTDINLKDYEDYKVKATLVVLGNIQLLKGPDSVFDKNNVTLKKGEIVSIKYFTENSYYYLEGVDGSGWVSASDLIEKDVNGKPVKILGYVKDSGQARVLNNIKEYDTDLKAINNEELKMGKTINYVGYVGNFREDQSYYAYLNKDQEIRFISSQDIGKSYNYELHNGSVVYVTNNKDVKIQEFNHPEKELDSSKILKNGGLYYIEESTTIIDSKKETYENLLYVTIDKVPYVITIKYTDSHYYTRYQLADHFGATITSFYQVTDDVTNGLLKLAIGDVKVYASPSTSSEVVKTLSRGTFVMDIGSYYDFNSKEYFLQTTDGWIKPTTKMFARKSDKDFLKELEEYYEDGDDQYSVQYWLDYYYIKGYYQAYFNYEDYGSVISDDIKKDKELLTHLYSDVYLYDGLDNANAPSVKEINKFVDSIEELEDSYEGYEIPTYNPETEDETSLMDVMNGRGAAAKTKKKEEKAKPIAYEKKDYNKNLFLPIIIACSVAFVVAIVIAVMLIVKHKSNKKKEEAKVEEKLEEAPVTEAPVTENPAEEPKEETPAEETITEEKTDSEAEPVANLDEEPKSDIIEEEKATDEKENE